MKMATSDGSPFGEVPEQGSHWFLVDTEASDGGTPDLISVLEVLGYVGIYGCRRYVGGPNGGPRGRGARPRGVGAPPTLVSSSFMFLHRVQVYPVGFLQKITSPVDFVPFRLRLIFLFFETLKYA